MESGRNAGELFLNPPRQNKVGLVTLVSGMFGTGNLWQSQPYRRLSDHLATLELLSREVNLDPTRKPVPHVPFNLLAIEEDFSGQEFSANDVVYNE